MGWRMSGSGKGTARYWGERKTLFDLRRTAVVHNLHVIARQPAVTAQAASYLTGALVYTCGRVRVTEKTVNHKCMARRYDVNALTLPLGTNRSVMAVFQGRVSGTGIALLPTGELMIGWQADGGSVVRLTPEATYALLVFLRQPGLAELIEERVGAARQDQKWREYVADGASDT